MSYRKYKNLVEVARAFKSGELDKSKYSLFVDRDYSFISWCGGVPSHIVYDSDEYHDYVDTKCSESSKWFRGNGYSDFYDALGAAGIPFEVC